MTNNESGEISEAIHSLFLAVGMTVFGNNKSISERRVTLNVIKGPGS